jgi:hypothetical protein
VVWPSSTKGYPLRSSDEIKAKTADPDSGISRDNPWQGIYGRSPLSDYKTNEIDLVYDMRIDYMHNIPLGVGKEILCQLLRKGPKHNRPPYFNYIKGARVNST